MGSGAGPFPLPPPAPPPPHATQTTTSSNTPAGSHTMECCLAGARIISIVNASKPHSNQSPTRGSLELGGTVGCKAGGKDFALAVVVRVKVADIAAGPDKAKEEGAIVQNVPSYVVLHDRFTVPVNPPSGVTVIVEAPDCPGAARLIVDGLNETPKSETLTVTGAEVDGP